MVRDYFLSVFTDSSSTDAFHPLNDKEMKSIEKRSRQLADEFTSNNTFLDVLGLCSCITDGQKDFLKEIKNGRRRKRKLLDFLKRRSRLDVTNFCEALLSTGQEKAWKLFKDGGCKILVKPEHLFLVYKFKILLVRFYILFILCTSICFFYVYLKIKPEFKKMCK